MLMRTFMSKEEISKNKNHNGGSQESRIIILLWKTKQNKTKPFLFNVMCMRVFCLLASLCITCVSTAHGDQKELSGSLKLEIRWL